MQRLRVLARVLPGVAVEERIPFRFDVELTEGWCWMVARPQVYVVGMAAEPHGDRTRFALLEGVSLRGAGPLRALVAPLTTLRRWRHVRHVPHDVDGIERLLGARD